MKFFTFRERFVEVIVLKNTIIEQDIEYILGRNIPWEDLKGAAVLVTGATGLIGSMLIRTLVCASVQYKLGLHVIALIRDIEKAQRLFDGCSIEYIQGDIQEKIRYLGKIDYIIHTASITRSKDMVKYPVEVFMSAVLGTSNVLNLAKEKCVKGVLYLSSMEMYGLHPIEENGKQEIGKTTENMLGYLDLSNPRTCYPEGKRACESLCWEYYSEYQVPVKIARLSQTFGGGVSQEDTRVFVQFAKSLLKGEDIILHTEGNSEGNYCYLADTIYGILLILLKGLTGQAYNISNEALHMTIRQMADFVADEISEKTIQVVVKKPEQIHQYGYAPEVKLNLSVQKLTELGWSPGFGMKDMYQRMIQSWQDNLE